MSVLNQMLLIENLYLKFHAINSRSCQRVQEINTERNTYGEFHHLYSELTEHPQLFGIQECQ
jgi:hypothetical protein